MDGLTLRAAVLRLSVFPRGLSLLCLAGWLAACSSPQPVMQPQPGAVVIAPDSAPLPGTASDVVIRAVGLIGTPYRWGGNTPDSGFDCSGLVRYIYRDAAGLLLPRTSQQMSAIDAQRVGRHQLEAGDLVFFGRGQHVSHVGIYVGEGRFVHAPNSGGTVRIDPLSGHYWRDRFLFARRPL